MAKQATKSMHLAELHELAAERGIERFRMLTRGELIDRLGGGDGEADAGGGNGDGRRRGGGRGRDDSTADEEARTVSGVLDITSRGHGFVRLEGLEEGEDDVYVSPSQIRRCELQSGDAVKGPARRPRRGERHPALVHVDEVNGAEPGTERSSFEDLDAVQATRRLPLAGADAEEAEALTLRGIDLLTPLARGHRVLVRAERGSFRTRVLRALAAELAKLDDLELVVVLIDERPEEEKAWREALPGADLAIAGADLRPGEQLRIAELAVARAKRNAERGNDVVLVVDSLSRLAVAADDPGAAKPIFAAGRETADEKAGALTVIATALLGPDEDPGVARALATTENVTVSLDSGLAEAGVAPALDVGECAIVDEGAVREGAELEGARALRAELAGLEPREAAERLREKLTAEGANDALLSSLAG